MKHLILLIIRLYWATKSKRRVPKCIFKKSCSHYVYEETIENGFLKGLNAFYFRYKNCRSGFEIFKNPLNGNVQILLSSKKIIESDEIAERLLNKNYGTTNPTQSISR